MVREREKWFIYVLEIMHKMSENIMFDLSQENLLI